MIIDQGTAVHLTKKGKHIRKTSSKFNLTKGQETYDSVTQLVKTEGLTKEQIEQVKQLMIDDKLVVNSTIQS